MSATIAGNNPALSPEVMYRDKEFIPALIADTVYAQLTERRGLPQNFGRSVTFVTPGLQPQDRTKLADGIPVNPAPTSSSEQTITTNIYGNVFAAGDYLMKTSPFDAFKYLMGQAEQAASYAYDASIRDVVFADNVFSVNTFAPNGKQSVDQILQTDTLSLDDVRFANFLLQQNAVKPKNNNYFAGVVTVGQKYDLTNQNSGGGFLDLAKQNPAGIDDIKKAMKYDGNKSPIGEYVGTALWASQLNPVIPNAGGVNVHYSAFWGENSLFTSDLGGDGLEIFVKRASKTGTWDVIEMLGLATGYKFATASLNASDGNTDVANQRIVKVLSASTMF